MLYEVITIELELKFCIYTCRQLIQAILSLETCRTRITSYNVCYTKLLRDLVLMEKLLFT